MGLLIVTGGANAGKTGVVHDAVRDAQRLGRQSVLLLPSKPEVERAELEFARVGALGIGVAQFDDYLGHLWSLLGDGRTLVRPTQRSVLVDDVIRGARLSVLAESAGRPGFTHMLERLVQRAGESSGLDGRRSRAARSPVAAELLALVDAYSRMLSERSLVEPADAYSLVAMRLERGDLPELVAVNRFSSFTTAQRRFIGRCAEVGCDIVIGLTWIQGHPATAAAQATVDELMQLKGASQVVVEEAEHPDDELDAVARRLFCVQDPERMTQVTGRVTLSEAAGSTGEVARIIRDVQEMVISGRKPEDIAIVYRQPERHVSKLVAGFKEAGIAVDIDARVPIGSVGLGRALLLLLAFLTGERVRADLMGFLRSGYGWADPGAVDAADERLRRRGIQTGPAVVECARNIGANTRLLMERAESLAAAPIDAQTVEGWRWLVADMLRAAHGAPSRPDIDGGHDAATQRAVMTALEELATLGREAPAARQLRSLLERHEVALTPSRTRDARVQVMSAERARARRFSAVIVAGLNAGEFPALPTDDAFSSPDLAAELYAAGVDVASRVDADAERLLFYQVTTGARDRLILSRTICDDDGVPMRASSLWEEFLDLYRDPSSGESYGGVAVPVRRLELADLAESEDAPLAERRRLRSAAAAGQTDEPRVAYAAHRARERTGCLPDDALVDLAATDTFSATEIEAYLACPFKWFYDRTLRPQQLDRRIDTLEKGTLAHEIMRRFYHERAEKGLGRVTPENLHEAIARHAEIAADCRKAAPVPESLSEEELLHAAVTGSRRIVERDASFLPGFMPIEHELAFDTSQAEPATQIGSFFLRGRVDRVDASDAGIVVIDYKTGSTVAKKGDFEKQGLVQLPLYGLVASAQLGRPLLGGLYRSMPHKEDRGFYLREDSGIVGLKDNDGCEADEFGEVIATAIEMSERAVAGMRAGRIEAVPGHDRACTYCGAAAVCGGKPR